MARRVVTLNGISSKVGLGRLKVNRRRVQSKDPAEVGPSLGVQLWPGPSPLAGCYREWLGGALPLRPNLSDLSGQKEELDEDS